MSEESELVEFGVEGSDTENAKSCGVVVMCHIGVSSLELREGPKFCLTHSLSCGWATSHHSIS